MQESKQEITNIISFIIKALTALMGRLSLSVGWEDGPIQRLKMFHLTLNFLSIKQTV